MIYTFIEQRQLQSGQVAKIVRLLLAVLPNGTFTSLDLLKNKNLLTEAQGDNTTLQITASSEDKHPIILAYGEGYTDITVLFNFFSKYTHLKELSDKNYTDILTKLGDAWANKTGITLELLKIIRNSVNEIINYHKEAVSFVIDYSQEFLKTPVRDTQVILEINARNGLPYLVNPNNKNTFMYSPEDTVFLKLPSYERVVSETTPLPVALKEVFNPYAEPKYYSYEYKEYLRAEDNIRDIIGYPENNNLDIQDNELDFFNAMKSLIDYGAQKYYSGVNIEDCRTYGHCHPKITEYLINLAIKVGSWNWSHTGKYPIIIIDDEDNEDGSQVDDTSTESTSSKNYNRQFIGENDNFLDAEVMLTGFIKKAIEAGNIYAPAEAVIKLLRWGNRKPTALKLDAYDKYLDLDSFLISNSSGTFADKVPVKRDGATFAPLALINASGKFKDLEYLKKYNRKNTQLDIPVGVLLVRYFEDGAQQYVAMSMLDFISYLKANPKDILGCTFNPNNEQRFTISADMISETSYTLDDTVSLISKCQNGSKVYYNTDDLENFFLEFNAYNSSTSELSILASFLASKEVLKTLDSRCFNNLEELISNYCLESNIEVSPKILQGGIKVLKGSSGVRPLLEANVANRFLPMVLDVAEARLEHRKKNPGVQLTPSDWVNLYDRSSQQQHLQDLCSVLNKNTTISATVAEIEKLDAFASNAEEDDEDLNIKSSAITGIPNNVQYAFPVVDNHKNCVGYMLTAESALKETTHYTFTLTKQNLPSPKATTLTMFVTLFKTLAARCALKKITVNDININFADEESYDFFIKAI